MLIVDDADHLQPEQLHRLTARAAEHSAKLVLVTTDDADPHRGVQAPSRHLTEAANIYLNWGHRPGQPDPPVWQHDLYRPDHTAYRAEEIEFFRAVIGTRGQESLK